jgi:CheY-like chemotaxis protein
MNIFGKFSEAFRPLFKKEGYKNTKKKILMVDDDTFLLEMYSVKIKDAGLDIETMERPIKDFPERVLEINPDLIVLDILMPEIDGFQAIQMLKSDPRTKDIPVMFANNRGQAEDIENGIALGAVDYIVTPRLTPTETVKGYSEYLNDPKTYTKRYPRFLEEAQGEAQTTARGEVNNLETPGSAEAKRGVFVLTPAAKGEESNFFVTFRYKDKTTAKLIPGSHLAIFNSLQFAEWYAWNLGEKLKENPESGLPEYGSFLNVHIADQKMWDFVRTSVLAAGASKYAVINPCSGHKDGLCPIVRFDLGQ